ncbi:MAG: type III-B CRISPR module RAMP protein Cmr6 [Lentimicrobiaceae bacterium]|jgi:CRISPR-associated protein Cmr6|nr:type III-B CRISPR module RAMP protein Cmr6 [Lentimicrobiaceae bacterium]
MSTWDQYRAPNLGLLFYKQIYKESGIKTELKHEDNELVIKVTKDGKPNPFDGFYKDLYSKPLNAFTKVDNPAATTVFKLTTTYPGLLTGSGYAHDTGATGDFKIGFFFDHTTGLPVIPGSSVKGVCRSIFEVDVDKNARNPKNFTGNKSVQSVRFIFNEILERYKNVPDFEHKAVIENILNELPENEPSSIDKLKSLVKSIFGEDKVKGSDIFFDAALDIQQNNSRPFLANDFITPHKHKSRRELDPFTNPNPIQFLKVRSEIPFKFRFIFTNTDEWTKEIKKIFFEQVLLTLGIGAKTNVGYGQFEP